MSIALRVIFALGVALAAPGCGEHTGRAAHDRPDGGAVATLDDLGATAAATAPTTASAPEAAAERPAAASAPASPAPRVRDPFLPPALRRAPAAPAPALAPRSALSAKPAAASTTQRDSSPGPLRGVMQRGGVRYAMFGERFVARGESVGGWTIIRIGETQCVLERAGRTKTLEPGEAP